MGESGFFRPFFYVYDVYYDCVICPENQVLKYSTTNRDGYREFKSKGCNKAHLGRLCRTFGGYTPHSEIQSAIRKKEIDHRTSLCRCTSLCRLYKKHAMRYTNFRGLTQVTSWVRLKFAAMNLKKYAIHRWEHHHILLYFRVFRAFLV